MTMTRHVTELRKWKPNCRSYCGARCKRCNKSIVRTKSRRKNFNLPNLKQFCNLYNFSFSKSVESIGSPLTQDADWRLKYDLKAWAGAIKGNKTELQCKFCKIRMLALKSRMIEHAESAEHKSNMEQSSHNINLRVKTEIDDSSYQTELM